MKCKFKGSNDLINITGELEDEFYIADIDYEENKVEAIEIKCE